MNRRLAFDDDGDKRHDDHFKSRIEGDSLSVFAAPFEGRSKSPPKQTAKRIDKVEIDHGWKDTGSDKEISEARNTMRSKVKHPQDLPGKPAFKKPDASPEPESDRPTNKNQAKKGQPTETSPRIESTPPKPKDERPPNTDRPPNADEKPARKESRPAPKFEPRAEPRMEQPREPKHSKPKSDPSPEPKAPQRSAPDSNDGDPKSIKAKAKAKSRGKGEDR